MLKTLNKNTALVVIDLENDLIHLKGKLSLSAKMVAEAKIIEKANSAIHWARQQGVLIIFVRVGFSKNYVECPAVSPLFSYVQQAQALQLNTWGTEFDKNLDVRDDDIIITKHRVSAFYATSLQAILTARQIQQVVLCGVSTDFAIQTTAREAHDRDYYVSIIQDACAANSIDEHRNTIQLLEKFSTIINSSDL
jgi:nicotinamidase-related amidase